jgi:hypothetical protein
VSESIANVNKPTAIGGLIWVGIATGVLAGLLGVGGGVIMVPALVALGFTRHRATATSLAAVLLVALSGGIAFAFSGEVDFSTALVLGLGGLVGSTVGAHWMNRLSGVTLARVFGLVFLLVGLRLTLGGGVAETAIDLQPVLVIALELVIGILTGIISGLAGIGGGVILVPGLVLLLGVDQHTAEGTSLIAILFTAAAGTRVNMKNRHVEWRAVWILGVAGAAIAPFAALVAQRIPADDLARAFGVFVILNAAWTLWKSRKG